MSQQQWDSPEIGPCRQESPRDTPWLSKHQASGSALTRPTALPPPPRVHEQQRGGREARKGSGDEVQKEELTSLGS